MDSFISDFWDEESKRLKRELAGKWWSIDKLGDFTDHCLEINDDGTYKSYIKGGRSIVGEFNFNINEKEIIFLNGTSFKKNLTFIRRGVTYYLEVKSEEKSDKLEQEKIKFRKLSDEVQPSR